MALGENIRKRRIALRMSQQQLADALGYKTRSSIAKIEKNQTNLSPQKITQLANVLQTSVNYILTGIYSDSESPRGIVVSTSEIAKESTITLDRRKCIAVILAGGNLRVNKYGIPFQFVTAKDKPVLLYTMESFQRHPQIDEIHVVCLNGWEDYIPAYVEKYNITKLNQIIPAGKTGIESVKNAIEWLSASHSPRDIIILQEATRPFVNPETISNAIRICKKYGSAVVFERMDGITPFLIEENSNRISHLNAALLINIQSPELYSLGFLRQAFSDAIASSHPFTETICAVFLHNMGRELKLCEGTHANLRIVNEEDLKLLEALL